MNRRDFAKLTALTAAGVAVLGHKAFAKPDSVAIDLDKQFSFSAPDWHDPFAGKQSAILTEPAPINEGPGPLWENFEYILKGPFLRDFDPAIHYFSSRTTFGWKGTLNGQQYGDYVVISDVISGPEDDVIKECVQLLKEQADCVRHRIIRDAKTPCFCRECKVDAFLDVEYEREGRIITAKTRWPFHAKNGWGVRVAAKGDGKGWYRAAYKDAEDYLWKTIIATEGPTHGYLA
jgi:hypothetical protein